MPTRNIWGLLLLLTLTLAVSCGGDPGDTVAPDDVEPTPSVAPTESPTQPPPTATAATAYPAATPAPTPLPAEYPPPPPTAPPAAYPADAYPPASAAAAPANADVLFVEVTADGENSYTFAVTVAHPDTGWEDYADGWDVVLPDGTVVKPDPTSPFTRLLLHPHEDEQPFTRSQSGIVIPAGVTTVTVRAHDIVDGFGGRTVTVDLTRAEGPDFSVTR